VRGAAITVSTAIRAAGEPDQGRLHSIDDPALLADEALALAMRSFGIFVRDGRDRNDLAVVPFAAQPAEKGDGPSEAGAADKGPV
jgi:hypothetical protein